MRSEEENMKTKTLVIAVMLLLVDIPVMADDYIEIGETNGGALNKPVCT